MRAVEWKIIRSRPTDPSVEMTGISEKPDIVPRFIASTRAAGEVKANRGISPASSRFTEDAPLERRLNDGGHAQPQTPTSLRAPTTHDPG